ncbi:receptor-like protein EIX2 [Papaver somniferum]|uniref:receptor-like protein EIX2 n=1 Tax=Papaver somniferum TaxID=3469 RepID=UPI000E702765|nr:receptor-like protein EIX2 [Papaver somniferum]
MDLIHLKERLVIFGNHQVEGLDYNQSFAPVAKMTAMRTFLAVVAVKNCIAEFPLFCLGCHATERRALLDIKSALHDPSNRLASWKEGNLNDNCCDWHGIACSNESFHVTSIDLRNKEIERYIAENSYSNTHIRKQIPNTALQGRISPSLFSIIHLGYLDLSYNDFQESQIPHQFSGLTKLNHLDLSFSNFSAVIPTQFTNISSLQFLDLSCSEKHHFQLSTSCIKSSSTKWLKGLVNLKVLRLRGIDLYEASISSQQNFGEHISYLSNLRDIDLSSCSISGPLFAVNSYHNFSRLSSLKMNYNYKLASPFKMQLANLTSLSIFELSNCQLHGSVAIPHLPQLKVLDVTYNPNLHVDLTRMFKHQWPKLQKLWISGTKVNGSFLHLVSNVSSLVSLSAASCSIQGSLPPSFYNLSQLQHLTLYNNSITGDVHSLISNLKYLYHLDLSHNKFQGTIPSGITKLQYLGFVDLSKNSIEGNVSLASLINEMNLTSLDLSSNKLTLDIDQPLHMYPILRLERLLLGSCNLKRFPTSIICNLTHLWLLELSHNNLTGAIPSCLFRLKYLHSLDLSHNNLSGVIPFNLSKVSLDWIDLSNNKLHGPLPLLPQRMDFIDISNNQFSGEIPIETGKRLSSCAVINLSGNKLSGPSLSSLCLTDPGGFASVGFMDLSNNKLSGIIPNILGHCTILYYLNLGNNNLAGNISNELKLAPGLAVLQLNGNNLEGTIDFISKLHNLEFLNLAGNNFGGSIPAAIGSLNNLKILSLRSNRLIGSIPEEIVHLQKLQILDLSINNLSRTMPRKMGNLKRLLSRPSNARLLDVYDIDSFQLEMVIKGILVQFEHLYGYSSGIDLSCNILNGTIPKEIGLLKGLAVLNLSHNFFSDSIPVSVGDISGLESFDVSYNRLSGYIPESLTGIDNLEFLNLSYNNLSGIIPRGIHFDTMSLDGSSFVGNELLCGYLQEHLCDGDDYTSSSDENPRNEADEVDREDAKEKLLLYAIVALGIVVGFWGLFFILLMKKNKWWFAYWRLVDTVAIRITICILSN